MSNSSLARSQIADWVSKTHVPQDFVEVPLFATDVFPVATMRAYLDAMDAAFHALRARHDVLLVEGAGGLLVPVTAKLCMADLAARWELPVVVAARAALGKDTPEAQALARELKDHLWAGRVDEVIVTLQRHADVLGPPQADDGPEHHLLSRGPR